MTPDELRAIMEFLKSRVYLKGPGAAGPITIGFTPPTLPEMAAAGLDLDGSRRILGSPWFGEMAAEVVDTPGFCEEGDLPETVLGCAKDVVAEYIRKRAAL